MLEPAMLNVNALAWGVPGMQWAHGIVDVRRMQGASHERRASRQVDRPRPSNTELAA